MYVVKKGEVEVEEGEGGDGGVCVLMCGGAMVRDKGGDGVVRTKFGGVCL